jgi:adenylate kinase
MKLIITGTPGTGKTTLAKKLGEKLSLKVINEKDFAMQNKIGKFNDANELEIPIKKFEKKANSFLAKKDNIIFEGHVLCEAKLKVDFVVLVTINPEELEERLNRRSYSPEKIMDNVFCEGIEYCKKHLKRNYSVKKIIEIQSKSSPNITFLHALNEIQQRIAPKNKK